MKHSKHFGNLIEDVFDKEELLKKSDRIGKQRSKLQDMIREISSGMSPHDLKKTVSRSEFISAESFWKLKSRAKQKIITSILAIDPLKKFNNSYDRAYFVSGRNLVIGRTLLQFNFRKEGILYTRSALRTATRFQFT